MVNGQFMCSRFFHQSKGLFMRLEPLILSTLTIQNSVTTQELREVCRSVEKVDKEIDKAILLLEKEKLITRVSEPTVKNTSNYVGPGGLSAEQIFNKVQEAKRRDEEHGLYKPSNLREDIKWRMI